MGLKSGTEVFNAMRDFWYKKQKSKGYLIEQEIFNKRKQDKMNKKSNSKIKESLDVLKKLIGKESISMNLVFAHINNSEFVESGIKELLNKHKEASDAEILKYLSEKRGGRVKV